MKTSIHETTPCRSRGKSLLVDDGIFISLNHDVLGIVVFSLLLKASLAGMIGDMSVSSLSRVITVGRRIIRRSINVNFTRSALGLLSCLVSRSYLRLAAGRIGRRYGCRFRYRRYRLRVWLGGSNTKGSQPLRFPLLELTRFFLNQLLYIANLILDESFLT